MDAELKNCFVSQEYVDSITETCEELVIAYIYVKKERPVLQDRLNNSYPNISFDENGIKLDIPYETNRLEKEIEEKDMKAMMTIVKHYQFMWT